MVKCTIKYENNPSAVFYNGSTMNGIVEVENNKPLKVRSIYLVIKAKARVYFNESYYIGFWITRVYFAKESYFKTITYLCGSPDGNNETIKPGSHKFKFTCELPSELPSSVESLYGKIRYSAEVVFDRPCKCNKTFNFSFTVVRVTDLNCENPNIRLPATLQIEKKFSNKLLNIEVNLPQTGYVSGQVIPVGIKVFNTSSKSIQDIAISIKQIINSISDSRSKKNKIQRINVTKGLITSIKNLENEEFHADLLVPPIPPTCNEIICRIVQVYYEVQIKAHLKGQRTSPVAVIPIIIGNISLNLNNSNFAQSSQSTNASLPNSQNPEICAANFGLPPPRFEEARYVENENKHANKKQPTSNSNYLPSYPVFDFKPQTSLT